MRSETLRSILSLTLMLLLCYFLQSAVFSPLHEKGCAPLLLPLFALGAGLLGNAAWGGGFGLAAGILCDAAQASSGLTFTLLLTAAGVFAGFIGDYVLKRSFWGYLAAAVVTLALSAGAEMFPLFFSHEDTGALLLTAVKQTGVSLLFSLPVYCCVRRGLRSWLRACTRGLTERTSRET